MSLRTTCILDDQTSRDMTAATITVVDDTGRTVGSATLSVFPRARTIESFEDAVPGEDETLNRLLGRMTYDNFSDARMLFYESEEGGAGHLVSFTADPGVERAALAAIQDSHLGRQAGVLVVDSGAIEVSLETLAGAGFTRFEETGVYALVR